MILICTPCAPAVCRQPDLHLAPKTFHRALGQWGGGGFSIGDTRLVANKDKLNVITFYETVTADLQAGESWSDQLYLIAPS